MMRYGTSHPPLFFWVAALGYLAFALIHSPNFWISVPVFLYPLFTYRLFWLNGQPNVIFWGMIFQWLSVSSQLLYSTLLGISMAEYMRYEEYPVQYFNTTILLSITALYFYAVGVFVAIRRIRISSMDEVLSKYSPLLILRWYIIVSVIIYLSKAAIWSLGSFVQYFYFFFYVQWGFFLVTFYSIHKKARHLRWVLYLAILAQFIVGLASFFADSFMNILIFTFIAIATLQPKIKFAGMVLLGLIVVLFFNLAVYWTASKQAYRQFLNKGEMSQSVMVSQGDALSKLNELVSTVDDKQYQDAIKKLVDRIGYVQYFDATLGYVPVVVKHQNGAVYAKAIAHYFVPRFLDPDKEVLDDSKHTNQFTGLQLGDSETATSFSLGTVADAYIDFGEVFMNVPIFLFGLFMGWCFKYLWKNTPNQLWAWVFTGTFYLLVPIYGTDTTKAIGFILIYFLTVAIVKNRMIRILDQRLLAT